MKKIFIVTGEPSGDKLASKVIYNLKKKLPNIDYLCVGGPYLKSLGIKTVFDLNEITYFAFTKVLFNKLSQEVDLTLDSGKAKLLSAALPLIEKIPSEFYQENILEQLGRLIGRTREQLNSRLKHQSNNTLLSENLKLPQCAKLLVF